MSEDDEDYDEDEADDEDMDEKCTYKFIANQNTEQMWSHKGVDGVQLSGVEFATITTIDAQLISLEAQRAKVADLRDPKLFLTCRYD